MQLINSLKKIMVSLLVESCFKHLGKQRSREGGGALCGKKIREGWLNSLGSEILIGKKIFWGSSKIFIWTKAGVAKMDN